RAGDATSRSAPPADRLHADGDRLHRFRAVAAWPSRRRAAQPEFATAAAALGQAGRLADAFLIFLGERQPALLMAGKGVAEFRPLAGELGGRRRVLLVDG